MASTQTSAASALQKLLTQDEYQSLSSQLSSKLSQAFQEQADECACLLTLHESEKQKNGDLIAGLRKDIESTQSELNNTQQKLVALSEENKTLATKYDTAHEKLEHAEATRRTLEKSVDELRHQRDTSTFSANALQSQFDFKETQLAQLKADMEHLRSELDAAVQSKFQAMVNQDEVEVKGKELQLKEAQLDKDRARMQQQIDMLNSELDKRNNDTIELRKESNKTFLELQNKLELRTSQHNALEEKYKRVEQLYKERTKETNELRDRLTGQAQDEIDYRVHLEAQLNAQKAFVQAHKEALDATKIKCADMETTIVELKTRLDTQNETQAQLEAENEELKRELAERVEHFNEQMKAADEMLFAVKSENLDKSLETLSPYAVEISKRLREGLTYTDLIKLYAEASEELVVKQGVIEALQGDMGRIMEELKEVAPKMRRKCDRLHDALQVIDHVTCAKEKLDHEKCLVEKERDEIKTQLAVTRRENDRNKAYVKDLCKQLCLFVKKEAEERGIPVPVTEERPPAVKRASLDLSSLVENRLLTFSCVEELQQKNLELLEAVRILEQELEKKSESLSEMKMQQIQQESKSDTEKQLEEMKAQNEIQKQHLKYLMILLRQPSGDTSGIEYNEEFQSFTARTRVSVEVQTDDSTVQYTVKDVEALRAKSAATVAKLESRVTELLSSESKLRQDLRTAESEAAELKIKLRKVVTENEYKEEMLTTMRHNAEITSTQVATLEKSSQSYRESCIKNESVVSALHEQLKIVSKKLAQTEVDAEQYKRELANMGEKVKDLTLAKEVHSKEQNLHVQLMSHIEGIKTQMDLSESMGKAKLESKLEDSLKELNGLRHKLSEEQNMHAAKIEMLNKNVDTMKRRLEEEIEAKNRARQDLEKVKEEVKRMENEVEKLRGEVDVAKRVTVNTGEKDKQVDQMKYEMMKLQAELKENQNMVTVTKQNEKSIQEICTTFEKHNRELTSQVKTAEATHQAKVAELTKQINQLTNELKKRPLTAQQTIPQTPVLSNSDTTNSEVGDLRQQLEQVREQLRVSEMEREKAVASYVRELQVHAEDSQVLPKLKQELSELKSALQTLENEKQAIQAKLVAAQNQLKERVTDVETEQYIVRQELEQARTYNETLFKALDELNSECNLSLNEIENSDQELRGNENVISVIKHLRQQSSLARIDKQNIECENKVMKSELDMLKRKLNESNELLNAERNKNQVNEKTLEKHTELVKKIEMMEVVSDSNRILREDRDKLQAQLNAVMKEKETFDAKTVDPLKTKISQLAHDLEMRNQQVEHLKKQSESWKKRSETLVVKANKSNPEDIERLNLEKETLSKQLKSERESYHANLEDLKTLRAENATQRDQLNQLTKQVNELKQTKEQLLKVKSELETCKTELAQLTTVKKELETGKTDITNLTTQLETTNQKLATQGQQLENTRKLALQLKGANAKMKKEKEDADKAQALKTRTEEEDKTKNEAHEALLKEKDEQIAKIESAKTNLETEMNNFKATLTQREERMKEVLKKCRQKMASQVLEMKQLKMQIAGGAGPSSGPSPDNEKLERTIAELREEKEKLMRDNEALQQKNNLLSRHLSVQSNSESMGAKPAQEPPTANIKPMSGAVTPWRETPFASIRPMLSMEPRTVVVTPTALQPQNLEPSSSHMDYIASTSTAVRQATILPTTMQQQPLQQTGAGQQNRQTVGETAAESTQHEEGSASLPLQVESPELDQQQSSSTTSSSTGASSAAASAQAASIVALVLPQERQDSTASQQMVSGSSSGVTGSSAGNSSQQQLVSGSSGAQTQQRVTGSSANGSASQQQLVSGSNNSSSSSSTTSSSQTSQQMVTGSNQQDEPVAGPSQQYRQEVPSTSTSQQVSDNSSNTVTTSRTSTTQKRARSPSDVTDSLVTAEPISIEFQKLAPFSNCLLFTKCALPTSSQRDQEDEIVVPDSDEEEEEEEDVDKTPPMSRMSPVVFGDEEHGNAVNFLSYNVTKSGSLIGVDQFNSPPPQFQMSLMNMNNVSRSNPNLSGDTKVRLQPRDKSKSMFDLVIVSDGTDRNSVKRSRSSSKGKDKPKLRKRESKSAENISRRSSSDRKVAKQVVMSDESLLDNAKSMEDICKPEKDAKSMEDITKPQNGAKSMEDVSGQPASALARKDSIFARRRISITNNDFNRRGSRSNGNLTESVENMASTLLTRRGSINLNRKNSITRKMSVTNEPLLKKVGNKPSAEERETYESVAGSVLMRRDSVKRFPDMKQLRKQNTLNYELDRNQSQSSESIGPLPRRDPFGDKQMSRSCSVTSVSEYKETLRKLLKSQESIDESNETNANNKKLESQSLVNITEQVEGDENVNKSESNIHKMIAVAKPTSILKNKIDFVPIPLDKERTKQNKDNNQTKARNFFGEDLDLGAIEYDAKSSRHESSPSRAPYSRIMANREDPLESRYSHIIANRIIVKPKQPQPDTKIQNGKDLHRRYLANQPHLKSNDYLIQTDFTAPARGYPTGDVRNYRDPSLDSSIEDLTPLKFTDFRSHDSVMNKLLADSKQKAENELGFVLGDSDVQDEDLTQAVTKFIDAEIKAIILQRYEEGEKPLDMSVPSTESKLFKTQNFTTKFIEIEREVCATQRIEGHDKKKKSVLIIKSTEPIFSSIENTFVISTEPKDDVILTSKFIQKEKEHSTALRAKKSKTPECKVTDTAEVNSPSQKFTAEFIERERVYSSFQTPHLILCKKIGGRKSIPPPISDGLKTDSNIKRELELTTKFLQMEREYCALQTQTVVQAVRRSVDSLNMVNQNIQELIDFTQKFIDGEKKAVAKESINSSRSESTNNVPSQFVLKENSNYLPDHAHLKESIEEKISSIKKKSPSREKEESPSEKREKKKSPSQEKEKKKSPSQEKEKKRHVPTQDEIDMILKRQSYDFALSKMNMTGVVPNINAYKTPSRVSSQSSRDSEPSSRLHDMTPIGQRERAEPDYAFIISQSNLNKQSFPQDKRSSFRVLKNDENRMSREEVLVEENVKTSSEDIPKELKSSIGKIPDSIQPNQETTEEGSSPKLEIKRESSPPKGHTNFEKEPVNNYQQSTTKTKYTEQGTGIPTSENPEYSIMTKDTNVFEAVEPSVREYASPEIETLDSRTKRLSGGERLPYEESMDKSESSIVNFFSASMETIKSRFTGHSDDFSDFVENMESELAEAINDVTDQQDETSDQFTNKLVETQAKPSPERKSSSKSFEDSHEEIENKIVTSTDIPEKVVDGTVEQTPQCGDYLDHTETSHSESKLKESEVEESLPKNLKQKRQDSVHKDSLSEYSQSADVTQESSHSAEVTNSVCDVEVTEKSAVDEAADVKRKSVENAIDEESQKKVVNQESLHDVDVVKDSVEEVKVTKDSAEEVHAMNTSIQENGSATQAPGDVINESIQENLSPKSSASEILSDSTIDNQLNECRNCPHTKVDSLDFLSDEELKCASDLVKEEGNLLDQLKKLEAEKRRVVSKDESIESGSQGESTLELVVEICQEEVTLDDKSDDKSPDLVVTQETSRIQDEVETFTTVLQETNTPKTKRKKKKKHHTSKEDLNQTIEPNKIKKSESESEISTSSDLVRTDSQVSGEKTPDLKSVEANVPPKTEDIIPLLKESDQLNVDSQEDNSASDTKSKSKKKKKKKSNKGIKEDSITINQNVQQEVGGQKEELIETEKEIDKLKPEPENIQVIEENVKVIEEQSTETTPELKEADDFIPIKKKKSKMTRHLTRAILDAMKGEAILQETDDDNCEETSPEDIPTDRVQTESTYTDETCEDNTPDKVHLESTYTHETSEDNQGIYEDTPEYFEGVCRLDDVCEEDEEFCRLDDECEEDEEFCRLDEVCDTIPEEESANEDNEFEHVGEVPRNESVKKTQSVSVQTSLDNQATTKQELVDKQANSIQESKPLESIKNQATSTKESIGNQATTIQESMETQATSEQESAQRHSSSSPPQITSPPEHRVDINTGLDVINCRLDIINQEISTIAHVLSNINNEIKHGSSTVVLDAALELSDRTSKLIKGARAGHTGEPDAGKEEDNAR
uniref:Nucleoprotein TPR n=1 Tax=Cacopsylla melanoneura TaxID=428564 RepID=A0A8D8PVW4_9HEMI